MEIDSFIFAFLNTLISALVGSGLTWLMTQKQYNRQKKDEKKQQLREYRKELHELISQTIIPFWANGNHNAVQELQIKMSLISLSNDLSKYENMDIQMQILRMRCTGGTFETVEFGREQSQIQEQINLIKALWEQLDESISKFIE